MKLTFDITDEEIADKLIERKFFPNEESYEHTVSVFDDIWKNIEGKTVNEVRKYLEDNGTVYSLVFSQSLQLIGIMISCGICDIDANVSGDVVDMARLNVTYTLQWRG